MKDNTLVIMPTITLFGLDGSHFVVWSPQHVNTCKTHQAKHQGFQTPRYSPPLTSREKCWPMLNEGFSPSVSMSTIDMIYWVWTLHTSHAPPECMLIFLMICKDVHDPITQPKMAFPINKNSFFHQLPNTVGLHITSNSQHGITYIVDLTPIDQTWLSFTFITSCIFSWPLHQMIDMTFKTKTKDLNSEVVRPI